jgi:hypothetical protein
MRERVGMILKRIRIIGAAVVLAGLSLACGAIGGPSAQINCVGTGQQYECTVRHTAGGSGRVCWDLRLTCANGTIATANSCVDVTPGQTANHNVPTTAFPNWSACDAVSTVEVVNTTSTAN